MAIQRILLNGTAIAAGLLFSTAAMAQANNLSIGGGTITYTGPAADLSQGVSITPTASSIGVNGISVTALNIGPTSDTTLSLSVTYSGGPSSIGGTCYYCGFGMSQIGAFGSTVGDLSLDTTASPGSTFQGEDAIDMETFHGSGTQMPGESFFGGNVTIKTGADTIIGTDDGIYAAGTQVTINSAAHITASTANNDDDGIHATSGEDTFVTFSGSVSAARGIYSSASNSGNVTVSGSVTGTVASVEFAGTAANTLTLQTGASLTGNALGSISAGASNALILQGQGIAANSFKKFNTVEVQNSGGGSWSLQGTSSFSGKLTVDTGGSLVQSDGGNTFASATNNGTLSVTSGEMLTTGLFTNYGKVTIGPGAELSAGSYTQTMGGTGMDQATIDPASIDIEGGTFGGTGTVIGNVTLNGATLQAGDASGGNLAIDGSYSQTGGSIVFYVDANGAHGFDVSSLTFTPGGVSLDGTNIIFDFGAGADPLAFLKSGEFDLDSFFKSSSGDAFGADFNLDSLFAGDTFSIQAPAADVTSFDFTPSGVQALAEAVPEPATWAMLLIGFGAIGWTLRRRAGALA